MDGQLSALYILRVVVLSCTLKVATHVLPGIQLMFARPSVQRLKPYVTVALIMIFFVGG
jgi:hypothetical protein